jgi:hypothetical protein
MKEAALRLSQFQKLVQSRKSRISNSHLPSLKKKLIGIYGMFNG